MNKNSSEGNRELGVGIRKGISHSPEKGGLKEEVVGDGRGS